MIRGEMEMTINDETRIYKTGEMIIIPSNAKRSGISITDCKVVDVFYPVREDYK